MKLAAFIEQVREAGGVVTLDGEGAIRCLGNPEVMTPEVRAAVERHGEAIRRFIERERVATLAGATTGSHGWCERCGRVVWVGTGAERLPGGELVCADCLGPWDIEAGSVPVDDWNEGEGRGDRYPPLPHGSFSTGAGGGGTARGPQSLAGPRELLRPGCPECPECPGSTSGMDARKGGSEMGTRKGSKTERGDDGDRLVNEIRAVCDGVRDRLCRVVQGRRPGQPSADLVDAVLEDAVWLCVQQRIGAKRG